MANLGGQKIKAGHVASIRVNPGDCQGVLDVMKAIGVDAYDGRSFAQCVSLALSSLLGMARLAGSIPEEPDPFKFAERMAPFELGKNTKLKQRYSGDLYKSTAVGVTIPALAMPVQHSPTAITSTDRLALFKEYEGLMEVMSAGTQTDEQMDRFFEVQNILGI